MSGDGGDGHDSLMSLLAGIGVGVLIGGLTALLMAPQTGSQTRAQLRESADDALGRLRESMDDLRVKVEEMSAQARSAVASRPSSPTEALPGDVAGAAEGSQPGPA